MTSAIETNNSIPKTDNDPKDPEPMLDSSLYIIGLVTLIAESARGIVFPVLWPLCQKLNGSTIDYGYLVGIFSLGRVVISSRLGLISDTHGHKAALTLAFSIFVFGTILWGNTAFINSLPALYIAQFVLGLGTGVLGVVRSYVVEQVAPARRTYILARLSATQYTGFAVTPLLGMLLLMIGRTLSTNLSYMLPGYFLLVMAIICLVLIVFKLENIKKEREYHVEKAVEEESNGTLDNNYVDNDVESGMELKEINNPIHRVTSASPRSVLAVPDVDIPLSSTRTSDTGISLDKNGTVATETTTSTVLPLPADERRSSVTTIAASIVEAIYNNRVYILMLVLNFTCRGGQAVYETEGTQVLLGEYELQEWQLGLLTSGAGIIGTIHLLFFKQIWTNRCSDMALLIGGLGLFGLSQLIVMNWGPGTTATLMQYCFAMYIVYGFAYPIANSAALGVFAKIQKDGKQATAQGHLASVGSLSRALLPVLTGYLNNYIEYSSAFAVTLILMTGSLIAVILLRTEIMSVTNPAPTAVGAHRKENADTTAENYKTYAVVSGVTTRTSRSDSAAHIVFHSDNADVCSGTSVSYPNIWTKLRTMSLSDRAVLFVSIVLTVCAVASIIDW